MEIKKAIITAAGKGQRTLSLHTFVDRDGISKTALQIIIEEILDSGVEEICIVICPGDADSYRAAAGKYASKIKFVEQSAPLGYGHAVFCAREFVGNHPFLLLVNDHLYISATNKRCAKQLVEIAAAENCSISAVQATHESKLPFFGAVGGRRVSNREGLYEISTVLEKPTPTEAEQHLIIPGLRAGYYLCFFGMHALTPVVMDLLAEEVARCGEKGGVQLSPALARLTNSEKYLACEIKGKRYDIGSKYGILNAQLAISLSGKDRDEVLRNLVELLAIKV
ncbi:MAG: sugar phosphate nucleotidyltransferase [Verrucomicrobiia bacterium]